jgi:hypothetical protein
VGPQGIEDPLRAKCPKDHSAAVRSCESYAGASQDTTSNAFGSSECRPPRLKCGKAKNANDDAVVVDRHSREWPGRVEPGCPQSSPEDVFAYLSLDTIAVGTASNLSEKVTRRFCSLGADIGSLAALRLPRDTFEVTAVNRMLRENAQP